MLIVGGVGGVGSSLLVPPAAAAVPAISHQSVVAEHSSVATGVDLPQTTSEPEPEPEPEPAPSLENLLAAYRTTVNSHGVEHAVTVSAAQQGDRCARHRLTAALHFGLATGQAAVAARCWRSSCAANSIAPPFSIFRHHCAVVW